MASGQARARLGSRGRPEESRTAILQAAIREFAREGIAGARTGGAPMLPAALRVGVGGGLAMAVTAAVGHLVGGLAL